MSTKDRLIASAQKNLEKGQIAKAVKDYQQLVDLEPRVIQHRQKLADLQSRAKMTADAVANYEFVAKHFAENGFFLKAIAVYKQIQKLDPEKTECYLRLAELNEKQGLMGNALTEYRNLAAYFERKNLFTDAASTLQKIKSIEPDNLNVRVKIADCLVRAGLREKGKDEFRELFETIGADADPAMALRLYEVFVPIFPNDADVQGGMARLLSRRGEHERAKALLKGLVKQAPDDPDLLEALAEIQQAAGELDNERLTLAHLLKKDPERSAARLRLATLLANDNQGERALQEVADHRQTLVMAGLEEPLFALYRRLAELLPGDERVAEVLRDAGGVPAVPSAPPVAPQPVVPVPTLAVPPAVEPVAPPSVAPAVATVALPALAEAEAEAVALEPGAPAVSGGGDEEISLNFLEEFGEIGEAPQETVVVAPPPTPSPLPEVVEAVGDELELDLGEFDLDLSGPVAEAAGAPEIAAVVPEAPTAPLAELPPLVEEGGEDVEVAVDFSLDTLPDFSEFAEGDLELPAEAELSLPDFSAPDDNSAAVAAPAGEAPAEAPAALVPAGEETLDFDALADFAEYDTSASAADLSPLSATSEWPELGEVAVAAEEFAEPTEEVEEIEEPTEEIEEVAELEAEIEELEPALEELEAEVEELEPAVEDLAGGVEELEPALEELDVDVEELEPALEELEADVEELDVEELEPEIEELEPALEEALEEVAPEELLEELALEEVAVADEGTPGEEAFVAAVPAAEGGADTLIVVPGSPRIEDDFDVAAEFADLAELTDDALVARDFGLADDLELLSGAMQGLAPGGDAEKPAAAAPVAAEVPVEEFANLELLPVMDEEEAPHLPEGFAPVAGGSEARLNLAAELEEVDFYLLQGLADEAEAICRRILHHSPECQPARQRLDEVAALRTEASRVAPAAEPAADGFVDLAAELFDDKVAAGIGAALDDEFALDGVLSPFREGVSAQVDSEDTESHYNLGIAYKEMGLLDDAIAEFDCSMVDPARFVDSMILKGMCLVEKGALEEAETVLLQGSAHAGLTENDRIGFCYELGLLYETWARPLDALQSFRSVAEIDHFFRDVGTKIDQLARAVGGDVRDVPASDAAAPASRNRVSFV